WSRYDFLSHRQAASGQMASFGRARLDHIATGSGKSDQAEGEIVWCASGVEESGSDSSRGGIFLHGDVTLRVRILAADHCEKIVRCIEFHREPDLRFALLRRSGVHSLCWVVVRPNPGEAMAHGIVHDRCWNWTVAERPCQRSGHPGHIHVLSGGRGNLRILPEFLGAADELSDRNCGGGFDWLDQFDWKFGWL